MKSSRELLQDLDRYAAALTVAAMVFESENIEWVWSNDAHRLADINSYLARNAKLLGIVGLKMNPAYRVLAQSDRVSAEEYLQGTAAAIEMEALEYVTGSQVEIRQSHRISQLVEKSGSASLRRSSNSSEDRNAR
jgi:hypothetical protein